MDRENRRLHPTSPGSVRKTCETLLLRPNVSTLVERKLSLKRRFKSFKLDSLQRQKRPVRRERVLYALQVVKRYAQTHRSAHRVKADSNKTQGTPFDEHSPNRNVAWCFHYLACLGKRANLSWIRDAW